MTAPDATHDATAEQREAARHLIAKVKHLKDAEQEAPFAELWARDARLAVTSNGALVAELAGRAAIMAFYRRSWDQAGHGAGESRETHVFDNPYVVAIGGDRLLATYAAMFVAWRGDIPRLMGFGEYRDEIVFEEGAWRIADRRQWLRRRPRRP